MRNRVSLQMPFFAALLILGFALGACHRDSAKSHIVQAANIPTSFDVTLLTAKDNQFDLDGAPLTEEDLKSALRYRKEQNLPIGTVLLKRSESEKLKNEHIISLARVAYQMNFRAFIQDNDGVISEVRATPKEAEEPPTQPSKPRPEPQAPPGH